MKLIGVVDWTNRDKNGVPIAGVIPLVEKQKGEWRIVDATDEFPSQGQVFWFAAHGAVENALVQFRAKQNPGQKDEYQVDAPELIWEVLDLRRYGSPADVRAALVGALPRIHGPVGAVRALVLCASDVLVGPVDLTRAYDNTVKLSGSSHPRVPLYSRSSIRPLSINDREQRLIRVDESAPSGYVDWDDDATVLKRAIEVSVKVAKQSRPELPVQTKKQIDDAASALASAGLGAEAGLNRYRLERALALIQNTDVVTQAVGEVVERLLAHPAVDVALNAHKQHVAEDVEQQVRDALTKTLDDKRKALTTLTASIERKTAELNSIETSLGEVEAAVDARVSAVLERPAGLLGEISVLRPLLGSGGARVMGDSPAAAPPPLTWSCSGENVKDTLSLRRILTAAARTRGVDPALMLSIHAATMAGLIPVTLGPGALVALTAYADGACGGRLLIVHVSPTAIHPSDFDTAPGGGLLAATKAAQGIDGISMVVLEGANRSPLEASVVPLLQLRDVGLSPLASARGLLLAASVVSGATTAPLTSQLWSHAVAIWPEPALPSKQPPVLGTISLGSELFALGDTPTDEIEELVAAWPDSQDLRPTLTRFGSALTRLYDGRQRVKEALLNSVVLPYIATALTADEQTEALSKAGDADGSTALKLRRLRRILS